MPLWRVVSVSLVWCVFSFHFQSSFLRNILLDKHLQSLFAYFTDLLHWAWTFRKWRQDDGDVSESRLLMWNRRSTCCCISLSNFCVCRSVEPLFGDVLVDTKGMSNVCSTYSCQVACANVCACSSFQCHEWRVVHSSDTKTISHFEHPHHAQRLMSFFNLPYIFNFHVFTQQALREETKAPCTQFSSFLRLDWTLKRVPFYRTCIIQNCLSLFTFFLFCLRFCISSERLINSLFPSVRKPIHPPTYPPVRLSVCTHVKTRDLLNGLK